MTPYATMDNLKSYLNQLNQAGGSSEISPTTLANILERATSIIRTAVRNELRDPIFDFSASTVLAPRSLNAGYGVFFPLPPHVVGSVSSVLDSAGMPVTAYVEQLAPPRYGDLRHTGDLWSDVSPAGWAGRYTVMAQWGYGPVPPSFTELCLEIAVDIWRKKDAGFFPEIGVAGEGSIPVVTEWDRLGIISAFVEQYRREARYE